MKNNLFLDMDGTMFIWNGKATMEELLTKEYYVSLPVYPDMKELIYRLDGLKCCSLYVCSEFLSREAKKGKHLSLAANFRGIFKYDRRIFVPYGGSKAEAAEGRLKRKLCEYDILIDDRTEKLSDWERHGGIGIKVLNGINGVSGIWKGRCMTLDGHMLKPEETTFDGYDKELYDRLIYEVYKTAVADYVSVKDSSRPEDMKEKKKIEMFLERDDYGLGRMPLLLEKLGLV